MFRRWSVVGLTCGLMIASVSRPSYFTADALSSLPSATTCSRCGAFDNTASSGGILPNANIILHPRIMLCGDASNESRILGHARRRRRRRLHNISAKVTHEDDDGATPQPSSPFFIREVREEDLGAAANILADSFYSKEGANFFTRRVDRMNTYLSLKSRFETFRYAERSGSLQCMLVACSTLDDNKVVAFCEVDNRPPGGEINPAPRPYISNLAVDKEFRRMGSATALVTESEGIVRGWCKPRLHLRVNDDNDAAKAMYRECGYEVESSLVNAEGETVLLLGKAL